MKLTDVFEISAETRTRLEELLRGRGVSVKRLEEMPRAIVMVGLPGSGKSTWRGSYFENNTERKVAVVSSDDIIEEYASQNGMTYSEAYYVVDCDAIKTTNHNALKQAVKNNNDIIVDKTNLTVASRARSLSQISKRYLKIGVHFDVDPHVLADRLISRGALTGKKIPVSVLLEMISIYVPPSEDEFDLLIKYAVSKD